MEKKNTDKGCKFDTNDVYMSLPEAKEEILRRWNDKDLRKRVEDFLGGDVPLVFKSNEPGAVLSRDIISPNKELLYFLDLVAEVDMRPVFLEYLEGKFVARNFNKYHLCRMFFHNGKGKRGGDKISTLKVVDFNKMEGKKMKDIKTVEGKNLVEFHHKLLRGTTAQLKIDKESDFSGWFNRHREMSEYYYLHYLALFLTHGILLDNFITKYGEGEFTEKKIIPSFKKLEKIFGIKPLVVALTPIENECDRYWWCYSNSMKDTAEKCLK